MKKKSKKNQWTPVENEEALQGTDPALSEEDVTLLSREEEQMLRAGLEQSGEDRSQLPPHDTSVRANAVRFAKKNKLVGASIVIIALALIASLILGALGIYSLLDSFLTNKSDFTVCLGEEKPYEVKYSDAVRDGVLYIDMVKVAKFTNAMIISGTKSNRKFTASDGTSLRFEQNSEVARINGERVEMWVTPLRGGKPVLAKARITDTECWIPYSFLAQTVEEGMRFRVDEKTNTITIKHIHYMVNGDRENATPSKILFYLGDFTPLPTLTPPPEYEWVYSIDITPYLDAITSENLLLANKNHPLGDTFKPDVVELTCATDGEVQKMQANAATALYAMMEEMARAGVSDVFVTSSYRSYAQQKYLYYTHYYEVELAKHPTWSDEQIYAEISTYSSRPGESEHQTGLCIDFSTKGIQGELSNRFENTDAFRWLSENAYKFGFILRYPENKVSETQYSYESWHYRFVGREAATEIYFNGMSLEEYLGEVPA